MCPLYKPKAFCLPRGTEGPQGQWLGLGSQRAGRCLQTEPLGIAGGRVLKGGGVSREGQAPFLQFHELPGFCTPPEQNGTHGISGRGAETGRVAETSYKDADCKE